MKEMLYAVRCLKSNEDMNFSGSWDNCLNRPASARIISSFECVDNYCEIKELWLHEKVRGKYHLHKRYWKFTNCIRRKKGRVVHCGILPVGVSKRKTNTVAVLNWRYLFLTVRHKWTAQTCSLRNWSPPKAARQGLMLPLAMPIANNDINGPTLRKKRMMNCIRLHGSHVDVQKQTKYNFIFMWILFVSIELALWQWDILDENCIYLISRFSVFQYSVHK